MYATYENFYNKIKVENSVYNSSEKHVKSSNLKIAFKQVSQIATS